MRRWRGISSGKTVRKVIWVPGRMLNFVVTDE